MCLVIGERFWGLGCLRSILSEVHCSHLGSQCRSCWLQFACPVRSHRAGLACLKWAQKAHKITHVAPQTVARAWIVFVCWRVRCVLSHPACSSHSSFSLLFALSLSLSLSKSRFLILSWSTLERSWGIAFHTPSFVVTSRRRQKQQTRRETATSRWWVADLKHLVTDSSMPLA